MCIRDRVKSGDEWQRVHEGQPVPEKYRVMAYPAPEILRDEAPAQTVQPLSLIHISGPIWQTPARKICRSCPISMRRLWRSISRRPTGWRRPLICM